MPASVTPCRQHGRVRETGVVGKLLQPSETSVRPRAMLWRKTVRFCRSLTWASAASVTAVPWISGPRRTARPRRWIRRSVIFVLHSESRRSRGQQTRCASASSLMSVRARYSRSRSGRSRRRSRSLSRAWRCSSLTRADLHQPVALGKPTQPFRQGRLSLDLRPEQYGIS